MQMKNMLQQESVPYLIVCLCAPIWAPKINVSIANDSPSHVYNKTTLEHYHNNHINEECRAYKKEWKILFVLCHTIKYAYCIIWMFCGNTSLLLLLLLLLVNYGLHQNYGRGTSGNDFIHLKISNIKFKVVLWRYSPLWTYSWKKFEILFCFSMYLNLSFKKLCQKFCRFLTHEVPRVFFWILSDFWGCCFIRPLEWGSRKKKFFLQPEVPFLGADENDPLILTGAHVANFFEFWPNFFYKWYSKWTRNRICEKYSLGSAPAPPPQRLTACSCWVCT